jgi:hypothetical protein
MGANRDNNDVCCCADMEKPQVLVVSWSQIVAHAAENVNIPSMTVAVGKSLCLVFISKRACSSAVRAGDS